MITRDTYYLTYAPSPGVYYWYVHPGRCSIDYVTKEAAEFAKQAETIEWLGDPR